MYRARCQVLVVARFPRLSNDKAYGIRHPSKIAFVQPPVSLRHRLYQFPGRPSDCGCLLKQALPWPGCLRARRRRSKLLRVLERQIKATREPGGLLISASTRYVPPLTDADLARMKHMGHPTKIIPDGFPWRIVPPWTNQHLERYAQGFRAAARRPPQCRQLPQFPIVPMPDDAPAVGPAEDPPAATLALIQRSLILAEPVAPRRRQRSPCIGDAVRIRAGPGPAYLGIVMVVLEMAAQRAGECNPALGIPAHFGERAAAGSRPCGAGMTSSEPRTKAAPPPGASIQSHSPASARHPHLLARFQEPDFGMVGPRSAAHIRPGPRLHEPVSRATAGARSGSPPSSTILLVAVQAKPVKSVIRAEP